MLSYITVLLQNLLTEFCWIYAHLYFCLTRLNVIYVRTLNRTFLYTKNSKQFVKESWTFFDTVEIDLEFSQKL